MLLRERPPKKKCNLTSYELIINSACMIEIIQMTSLK